MAERFLALNLAARAFPPLEPPSFPRATAAGFLGRSSPDPVACWTRSKAATLGSLLGRLGMDRDWVVVHFEEAR